MLSTLYAFARPALFALEPEVAHEATLKALESGIYPRTSATGEAVLAQTVFGLNFPNPIGIAAGYDKDARVPDAVLGLGCGFAEVGTLTPRPQSGNPQPRVFRLIRDNGLINRLGFNNGGHAAALQRLEARAAKGGVVGVNIGANKDSTDRSSDYVKGIETFHHAASYFTVNISSPNTPGLARFTSPRSPRRTARPGDGGTRRPKKQGRHPAGPVIVKIAPDIAEDDIAAIVGAPQSSCRRRHSRLEYDTVPRRLDGRASRRSRRPIGPAGVQSLNGDAGPHLSGDGRQNSVDRHRRHRQSRNCARQNRSWRDAAAALHRPHLSRTGTDRGHTLRPRIGSTPGRAGWSIRDPRPAGRGVGQKTTRLGLRD